MIGLIVITVGLTYFLISSWVVKRASQAARRRGVAGWKWGLPAALVMYLLVFWDHIPTLALHHYYCKTQAGVWVYKTPEQWKVENPGVAETLRWKELSDQYQNPDGSDGYILNERFVWEVSKHENFALPVRLTERLVIDIKNKEVMARSISVGSGHGSLSLGGKDWRVLKFWVGSGACVPKGYFDAFDAFKKLGVRE